MARARVYRDRMQIFFDIIGQTLRTLWAHKLRSFLTMFGIAWGVGSLLLLVGLGEGFRSGQKRELDSIGENIMFFFGGRVPAVPGSMSSAKYYRITYDDYLAIREQATAIRYSSPVLNRGDIRAVSDFNRTNGQVVGVLPEYNKVRLIPMETGRWLSEQDNEERRRVTVIGDEMRKNIFNGQPAVGSTVLLNGVSFKVIGVLQKIGREGFNGTNIRFFVPINTMRDLFRLKGERNQDAVSFINYTPRTRELHDAARIQLHQIIARRKNFDWQDEDAFDEWDTVKNADTVGKIFDAMDWFLGGVGIVTMMLGAIGVINIMLVSVTERTKEIGLRKALGATNGNILTQFFLEGAFLTLLSGGLGLAFVTGLVSLLAMLPQPEGFDTPRIVPASAALAISMLGLAGIVAGLYPARKAAMLTPVEALRKE